MLRKYKFALSAAAVFLLIVIFISVSYLWFLNKMRRVDAGTARPTFPYSDYSIEELNKMYPQYAPAVATVRTPEETHALFMKYLKAGELDSAVECCFMKGDWVEMKAGLARVKEKGELGQMVGDLDTEIRNDLNYNLTNDAQVTYFYAADRDGKKIGSSIDFIKNSDGVWLIKSL